MKRISLQPFLHNVRKLDESEPGKYDRRKVEGKRARGQEHATSDKYGKSRDELKGVDVDIKK